MRGNTRCLWTRLWACASLPSLTAMVIALHLLASTSMRGADAEVLEAGLCTTNSLVYQEQNCISFDVSKVEFRPVNDAYFTTEDLCHKFGDPDHEVNFCFSATLRDVTFSYKGSNNTLVFSLHMQFVQTNEVWKISFINFTDVTKPGIHSYSFSQNLQNSNDFYAYLGETYQCDMVSFMDDKKTTGITFTGVKVQPFSSSNANDVRYCHDTDTPSVVVGVIIGTVVGAFVVLALVTLVIILVYRRLRHGNYNLLDS